MISVAAELAGMHPQTLRLYERRGLVRPQRTAKNTRRYSERDVERLQRIQELTELGLNLAGVERVLAMQEQLDIMASPDDGAPGGSWRRPPRPMRREVERVERSHRMDLVPVSHTPRSSTSAAGAGTPDAAGPTLRVPPADRPFEKPSY